MSEYRDFVSDFPSRCAELLSSFEQQARHRRREVTLMLCVAAPTIIVPLERLKSPSETNDSASKLPAMRSARVSRDEGCPERARAPISRLGALW